MSDNEEEKSNAGSEQPEPLPPPEPVKKEMLVKGLSRIQRTHGKYRAIDRTTSPAWSNFAPFSILPPL